MSVLVHERASDDRVAEPRAAHQAREVDDPHPSRAQARRRGDRRIVGQNAVARHRAGEPGAPAAGDRALDAVGGVAPAVRGIADHDDVPHGARQRLPGAHVAADLVGRGDERVGVLRDEDGADGRVLRQPPRHLAIPSSAVGAGRLGKLGARGRQRTARARDRQPVPALALGDGLDGGPPVLGVAVADQRERPDGGLDAEATRGHQSDPLQRPARRVGLDGRVERARDDRQPEPRVVAAVSRRARRGTEAARRRRRDPREHVARVGHAIDRAGVRGRLGLPGEPARGRGPPPAD